MPAQSALFRLKCGGAWSGVHKSRVTNMGAFIKVVWRNYITLKCILNTNVATKRRQIMTPLAFDSAAQTQTSQGQNDSEFIFAGTRATK